MDRFNLLLFLMITNTLGAQNVINLALANSFATQQQTKNVFEENKGQVWDSQGKTASYVKYHFKQKGIDIFMLPNGLAYQFTTVHYPEGYKAPSKEPLSPEEQILQDELSQQIRTESYRLDMQLLGANPNPTILAEGKSKDYVQYYNRNALNVHSFRQLTYQDVYPGIDWVIYTTDKGLKYDFILQPGADPKQIQLQFNHHEDLKINADGSFTLFSSMGSITEQAPISFQGKQKVATAFRLEKDIISFEPANYDKNKVLRIDPSLIWASYYGGNGLDDGRACSVDGKGNVYLAGLTSSISNIAAGGHQNTYGGNIYDAFIVKFNPNGIRLWASYYGGSSDDYGYACAVDRNENVYLIGRTSSTSNIAIGGHQNSFSGGSDAFILKLNLNGTRLWASYYGGSGDDVGLSCTVDKNENIYLIGYTSSSTNIAAGGHQNNFGGNTFDAFIVKFNPNGTRLWASYYGGSGADYGHACAVDSSGNVYLAGSTTSNTNIATGGHQNSSFSGGSDAFIVKFNPNGTRLWASYYGGSRNDHGHACAIDKNENIYLAGVTSSTSNIAAGGHQNIHGGGNWDAFIVKFNPNGTKLWASYYGGGGHDYANACAVDNSGNVYLAGGTESTSNISSRGGQNNGFHDAFIARFNPNGTRLWASYYGGNYSELAHSCAVDKNKNIYLAGYTSSSTNIAAGGHQNSYGGGPNDAFIVKIDSNNCFPMATIDTQASCYSYTWIDGNTYTINNTTATHTLTSITGCDSVIILNLSINYSTTGIDTQFACGSYTWIDGNTYTSNNNSATYTLTNSKGCDSIVTLNLTISPSSNSIDTHTACNSFTWIDGNTYTASNNTATHTLTNSKGCDSIVTLNLTISPSSNSIDSHTACDAFTWMDGNTYTVSNNTATYTLTNSKGCDSIVTLNLTITTLDTTLSVIGTTISSNAVGVVYQWLDCNHNYTAIPDSTYQSFSPAQNGDYAVMLSQNGCVDTSACISITIVGMQQLSSESNITIYPNPTDGNIQIDFGQLVENASIKVYSTNGKLIQQQTAIQGTIHTLELPQTTGLYILKIHTLQGPSYYKVIKK